MHGEARVPGFNHRSEDFIERRVNFDRHHLGAGDHHFPDLEVRHVHRTLDHRQGVVRKQSVASSVTQFFK